MNIDFKYLKLKNFLSFGNKETTYHFEHGKIVNVKGRNLDIEIGKENGSSNGSGKSACYQAIVYAIYGNGINDIKQDEFINLTNGKGMMVELALKADNKDIRIIRTRKPNSVQLFVNGEDLTRDSIANTSTSIEELIGVNYDTFVLSFMMTTAVQPLLARKPAEQRNFMEDLLGMNTLTERSKQVKRIRDDAQVELRLVEKDIEHADEFNKREQRAFDENKERFNKYKENKALRLESLKKKIDEDTPIFEQEESIREAFSELKYAKHRMEEAEGTLTNLKNSISEKKTEMSNIKLKINELTSSSETIKSKLVDEEAGLKNAKTVNTKASKELTGLEKDVDTVEEVAILYESIEKLDKSRKELKEQLSKLYEHADKLTAEIGHLQDESCPYCKQQWNNDDLKSKIDEKKKSQSDTFDAIDGIDIDMHNINDAIATDTATLNGYSDKFIKEGEVILDKYDNKKTEVRQSQADIDRHTKNIERLKKSLADAEAHQSEIPSLEGAVDDCAAFLDEFNSALAGVDRDAEEASQRYVEKSGAADDTGFDSIVDFERKMNEIQNTRKEFDTLKKEKNPYDDPKKNPPELRDVDELKKTMDGYNEEIKHCVYLIKLLTDSKSFIRRNIIGRYIPYLNKMINTYADRLDSPHICEIENDLSVKIEYMRKPVSYHSLSAGERLKLDVGVSMALRDLMTMIGVKSGFLMVDELFDSALDTQSKRNVFKLIKERFESVMLVSHSGEFDDKCDSEITIVKENGFSCLVV